MKRIIFSLIAVCLISSEGFCQVRVLDIKKDSILIHRIIRLNEEQHFVNDASQSNYTDKPVEVNEKIPTANQFIQGLVRERGQKKIWTKQECDNYRHFISDLYSCDRIPQGPDRNWPLSGSEWSLYRSKMAYYNSLYPNKYDFISIIQWRERNEN